MLKRIIVISILIGISGVSNASEYWISMTLARGDTPGPTFGGPKILLKIDSLGNLLLSPTQVIHNSSTYLSPPAGATALSQNGRYLFMWFPTARRDPANPKVYHVFKAVIEKRNLNLLSLRSTRLGVPYNYALQVTQKAANNFLAMESFSSGHSVGYFGVPISEDGKIDGNKFSISSVPLTCSCEMGLSANGRIFFFLDKVGNKAGKFTIQRLDATGQPVRKTVIIEEGSIAPQDITNIMVGNRRVALYSMDIRHPKLFLQALKGDTLETIGDPILLARQSGFGLQTAVVDPQGHFVVYGSGSTLYFQALDALGHPSGSPRSIANIVGYGFDILKNS